MRAYVGVDWSANKVVCSTALEGEPVRGIRGCDRVLDEVADLLARVRERHPGAQEVHVLIEAGAVGWVRLFDAAGALVHIADPKQAKRFAESLCSSGAKDDRRDSVMLTEMLRSPGHCPPVWSASRELEPLESLAAAHEQVTKEIVRSQQQLRSVLRQHMPLVEAQMKNLRTGWVRRFLHAVPTPWHAAQLDNVALDDLLAGAWRHRRQDVREALTRTEAPWLDEALASIEAIRIRQLLDRLNLLIQQLLDVDSAIDQATKALPQRPLLESVAGIGMHQAATLIQHAFGEELKHRDHAGVQLGACPVFVGSAQHTNGKNKGYAKMRRAAHHRGRRSTYLLGRLATRHHDWAAAMYRDGRARGQSAATAYRRIARSFLRILSAMIRNNEVYDEARYVAALQARGVPWAMGLDPSP